MAEQAAGVDLGRCSVEVPSRAIREPLDNHLGCAGDNLFAQHHFVTQRPLDQVCAISREPHHTLARILQRGLSGFGDIDRRLQERARMTGDDPRFAISACVNGINVVKVPDFFTHLNSK